MMFIRRFTDKKLSTYIRTSHGITLHLWEEGRFPGGGGTEMIASQLNFKGDDLHFGQIITSCYVIFIVFIPFFFPEVLFLAIDPYCRTYRKSSPIFWLSGCHQPGITLRAW